MTVLSLPKPMMILRGINPSTFARQNLNPFPYRQDSLRAAFLTQLHRTKNMEEWLRRAIEERIELEEAAFIGDRQDLTSKVE
ncbi:MAG: hypothetical protein Q8L41_10195 [Anaerolineales bacterium]|nr:hypothetical protein [Anaerolineales bacterium]